MIGQSNKLINKVIIPFGLIRLLYALSSHMIVYNLPAQLKLKGIIMFYEGAYCGSRVLP